ncbi:MAG TPA: hypothetical protein VF796_31015, partial [Humisphaera sp.]
LAGAGLLAGTGQGLTAAVGGLLAALAATWTFKLSSKRTADRTATRRRELVRDLSVSTLDRTVPVLIERLLAAGLAPVFVVDELDKVGAGDDTTAGAVDAARRIDRLVLRLKKLVAETAFFCFLVDRPYYEHVTAVARGERYGVGHTTFSDRVFVVHRPADFHAYLREVLRPPASPQPPATGAGRPAGAGGGVVGGSDAEDAADYPVVPYVLLHRARMHAIDLRRRIDDVRTEADEMSFRPGDVRSLPVHLYDLYFQAGIEMVLASPLLATRLDRDPDFRRLAHDALYFPSRAWARGRVDLDVSEAGLDGFRDYLLKRAGLGSAPGADDPAIDPETVGELYQCVRALLRLMADPDRFESDFKAFCARQDPPMPEVVACVLPVGDRAGDAGDPGHPGGPGPDAANPPRRSRAGRLPPPVKPAGPRDGHKYKWVVDPLGRPLVTAATAASGTGTTSGLMGDEAWRAAAFYVQSVADAVARIAEREWDLSAFGAEWGLLSPTPAWATAAEAIAQLVRADASGVRHEGFADDVSLVGQYAAMLVASAEAVALALQVGGIVGGLTGAATVGKRVRAGLAAVCDAYGFAASADRSPVPDLLSARRQLVEAFAGVLTAPERGVLREDVPGGSPVAVATDGRETWEKFAARVHRAVWTFKSRDPEVFRSAVFAESWESWWTPLIASSGGPATAVVEPTPQTLLSTAAGGAAGRLVRHRVGKTTVRAWSTALRLAAWPQGSDERAYCPAWVAAAALIALGFGEYLRRGADLVRAVLGSNGWGEDELRRFREVVASATGPGLRHPAVAVTATGPSLVDSWVPGRHLALLAMSRDQWDAFLDRARPIFGANEGIAVGNVFVEVGPGPAGREAAMGTVAWVARTFGEQAVVLFSGDRFEPFGEHAFVIGPLGPDDLIEPRRR